MPVPREMPGDDLFSASPFQPAQPRSPQPAPARECSPRECPPKAAAAFNPGSHRPSNELRTARTNGNYRAPRPQNRRGAFLIGQDEWPQDPFKPVPAPPHGLNPGFATRSEVGRLDGAADGKIRKANEACGLLFRRNDGLGFAFDRRPVLIVTVGLPCSGKSAWARSTSMPVVSRDAIRRGMHGGPATDIAEPWITAMQHTMIAALFYAGHPVVIADGLHTQHYQRREWQKQRWYQTVFVVASASADECESRARETGRGHLADHIHSVAARWEPLGSDQAYAVLPENVLDLLEKRDEFHRALVATAMPQLPEEDGRDPNHIGLRGIDGHEEDCR